MKALKNIDAEIFVVDNSSDDGSAVFFQNRFPQVNFIWNDNNSGFAKANNQALKLAKGEYILFLNPDTIVPEDCFDKCLSFIRSQKNNTALGIKMLNGTGAFLKESKRAFPSPATSFFKITGMAKLFPHSAIFAKYHLGHLEKNHNHPVDVLAGAFMMIPKKILDITGGFDEQFFMYGEDIDLSFRIQKAGFSNYYFAESTILHFKGESTKKGTLNYVKMFYKAMSLFAKKHYGGRSAGLFNFFIQTAIFMRAGISAAGKVLKPVTSIRFFNKNPVDYCIVGTEEEIGQARKLLEEDVNKTGKLHVICLNAKPGMNIPEIINRIENFGRSAGLIQIIFCQGFLSYKNILDIISKIKSPIHIHLFSEGSHAIIAGKYEK